MKASCEQVSIQSENYSPRYKTESAGINFVTTYKDTTIEIEEGIGIQSSKVSDFSQMDTSFFYKEKLIGLLSFEKRFLGKIVKIKNSEGNFEGVLTEDRTELKLDD